MVSIWQLTSQGKRHAGLRPQTVQTELCRCTRPPGRAKKLKPLRRSVIGSPLARRGSGHRWIPATACPAPRSPSSRAESPTEQVPGSDIDLGRIRPGTQRLQLMPQTYWRVCLRASSPQIRQCPPGERGAPTRSFRRRSWVLPCTRVPRDHRAGPGPVNRRLINRALDSKVLSLKHPEARAGMRLSRRADQAISVAATTGHSSCG